MTIFGDKCRVEGDRPWSENWDECRMRGGDFLPTFLPTWCTPSPPPKKKPWDAEYLNSWANKISCWFMWVLKWTSKSTPGDLLEWTRYTKYVTQHQQMRRMSAIAILNYVNTCAARSKFVKCLIMVSNNLWLISSGVKTACWHDMLFVCLIDLLTKLNFSSLKTYMFFFFNFWRFKHMPYLLSFPHIFRSGIKMIFLSKWFLIPVEYIDSKITIWPPRDINLICLWWVTKMQPTLSVFSSSVLECLAASTASAISFWIFPGRKWSLCLKTLASMVSVSSKVWTRSLSSSCN